MNFKILVTKPENLFVVIALIFGILLLFVNYPFHGADEYGHFYRAYQVADGYWVGERQFDLTGHCYRHAPSPHNKCVGGPLPTSLVETAKIVYETVRSQVHQTPQDIFQLFKIPLDQDHKKFVHLPNTILYSPVPYGPQALGIWMGKRFNWPPIALLYIGRFFNLLVWVILGYISLRTTPIFKRSLCLLNLNPVTLFQAASLSADALTNGVSLWVICLILFYAFEVQKKEINHFNILTLGFLLAALVLCKQAYFFTIVVFLIIPVQKFPTKIQYFTTFAALSLVSALTYLCWSFLIYQRDLYVELPPGVATKEQFQFLLQMSPLKYATLFINTFSQYGILYWEEGVGKLGGFLATKIPPFPVYLYLLGLTLLFSLENCPKIVMSHRQKLTIALSFCLSVLLLGTIGYLYWTPVGFSTIEGMQGRYFIPMIPLLFLLLYNQKIHLEFQRVNAAIALFCLCFQTYTLSLVINNYYF